MVHRAEHTGAAEVPATYDRAARPAVPGVPRTSVTARVWRLVESDTSSGRVGAEVDPFPARDAGESRNLSEVWPVGTSGRSPAPRPRAAGRDGAGSGWTRTYRWSTASRTVLRRVREVLRRDERVRRAGGPEASFPQRRSHPPFMRLPPGPVGMEIDVAFGDSGMGSPTGSPRRAGTGRALARSPYSPPPAGSAASGSVGMTATDAADRSDGDQSKGPFAQWPVRLGPRAGLGHSSPARAVGGLASTRRQFAADGYDLVLAAAVATPSTMCVPRAGTPVRDHCGCMRVARPRDEDGNRRPRGSHHGAADRVRSTTRLRLRRR